MERIDTTFHTPGALGCVVSVVAFLLVMTCTADAFAQQRTRFDIRGTVVSDDGRPLPGVSIRLPNTTVGTATDEDGTYEFTFTTAVSPVIVEFSFIGFVTERVSVIGSGVYDVTMTTDILRISEVVVTGTSGLTEKKQLGNSISTVDGGEIAGSGAVDVSGALSGKIPGALVTQTSGSPAGEVSVKLRGNSTINSDSEPLYIIDGVIVDNSSNELVPVGSGGVQNRLVDLNPNDIERIEVIKGAAAAAIYGSRASNGVVQIFTKRGRVGAPRVTYSTTLTRSEVRKTVKVNDAPVEWVNPADNSDLAVRGRCDESSFANCTEVPGFQRFDYQDYIFDAGIGTDQYLSVAGGTDRTTYFISGAYYFNEGIVRNADFSRTSLRVNVGQALSDWVFVNVGTNLARSFSNDIPTGGEGFFDGPITAIQFLPHTADAFPDELGNYSAPGPTFVGNPNEVIDRYEFTQEVNRFTGSLSLNLTPYEGLSIDLVSGYDTYGQVSRGFKPVGTVADPDGFTRRGDISRKLYNIDLNARYETPLSDDFTSTTAVGGTYQYDKSEAIVNEASNLGPIVRTIDGGTISSSFDVISERSLRGVYLQETIGYRDRIFVTVAGRVDGSSVFGDDHRSQFYPKVSGAYVLSDEPFWSGGLANTFDVFKIRASLGKAGNLTGIGPFDRFTNYNPISFGGQTGLIPSSTLGNPDIKPETQTEIEVGADVSMLRNRLGIEFTYYSQNVDDLLLPRELSPSTGAESRFENVGKLTNKGIEVMVRGMVLQREDLDLQVTALFSRNRNKVIRLVEGTRFGIGGFSSQYAIEDQPLGVFYWRAYARDANGNLLLTPGGLPQAEQGIQSLQNACEVSETECFAEAARLEIDPSEVLRDHKGNLSGIRRDADGQPDGELLRLIVGDPNPDWTGSLIANLDYKKWSFRMQWDAVQGADIFNWNRRNFDRRFYQGGYDYGRELKGEVQKGRADATGSGLIIEEYVEDGSFIKLREVSVSYTFTPNTRHVRAVRVNLSGRNLLSIDDYTGYDPEIGISGRNTGVRGFDFGAVPIPRTFSLGATLTF